MGKQLVEKMIPSLNKMQWPASTELTPQGRQAYEVGRDKVDSYRLGEPKTLAAALRIFQSGNSQPFAYAGVAYTLVAAARERDSSYAQVGLDAAMEWLEKAQESAPDVVDINVIEGLVYIYSGRLDDARLILDYLQQQDPASYYLQVAELAYWQAQGNVQRAEEWFQQASQAAVTTPQRLRLISKMADFYMQQKLLDKALQMYKEAIHFDKENAWLWHNVSLIYWQQENYEEADRYNKQALKLANLPAARKMEAALKKKLSGSGILGRFIKGE